MNTLEHRTATVSVLVTEPPADARLNIGDRGEIDMLCAAFACTPTDIYVGVAMVGDRIDDVRRYLRRTLGREEDHAARGPHVGPLPPLWPTVS